jgi:hypothetical protein
MKVLYNIKYFSRNEGAMQDRLSQIQFVTANYSRLQGLRAVPVGILAVFVSVWTLYNQGPTANLNVPILVAIMTALLYWLTDRYYNQTFGQVQRTSRQRTIEIVASIGFGALGLVAFALDTSGLLPISTVGLVFALSFLEYFSRANPADWKKIFTRFPENVVAAILIVILSLLPIFGIFWWNALGIKSQVIGILLIVGAVIIVTGIWGHVRLVRALSVVETRSDDNPL